MRKSILLTFVAIFIASFSFSQKSTIIQEGFEGGSFPDFWSYQDVTGGGGWQYQTGGANGGAYPATAHTGTYNACYRGFPNPSLSKLVTPALDLSNGGTLNFWWASHTYFGAGDIDILTVYYKEGTAGSWNELASYEDGADDWTEATFNIPTTSNEVYIAFEGSYQGGMGVCIDDVHVFTSDTDLGVENISPILAFGAEVTPTVEIANFGLIDADEYSVELTIIDGYSQTVNVTETVSPNNSTVIEFPAWTLPAEGTYEMTATVTIDGDAVAENNSLTVNCVVDQTPVGNAIGYFDVDFEDAQGYHCAYPETDGENIYVGAWNSNRVQRFTMDGNPDGDYFTIGNIEADDLAYDGQYFYSGTASGGDVYKMDFTEGNEQLVETITPEDNVSSLAYLSSTNSFWGNSFNSLLVEFDENGENTGNNISLGGSTYVSALAIDEYTDPQNPKIWVYQVVAASVVDKLVEYSLDGTPTGQEIPLNSTQFPNIIDNNDQGGGLACYVNDQNQVILLVGVQHLVETFDGRIIYVYLGEAVPTYAATISVVDENSDPIEGATVSINETKTTLTTDENGEASITLPDGDYEFAVSKDCYISEYGSFAISGAVPTIDQVVMQQIDAPQLTNGVVQIDGLTIELTFDNPMDLNGQTAPAGFQIESDLQGILTIESIELKDGLDNVFVISILDEDAIFSEEVISVSYTPGQIQSDCEIALEEIVSEQITNNSVLHVNIEELNAQIEIYPNPSNGVLTISNLPTGVEKIKILNMSGRVINNFAIKQSNDLQVDLSSQPKGVYFLRITSNQNTYTKFFIIN